MSGSVDASGRQQFGEHQQFGELQASGATAEEAGGRERQEATAIRRGPVVAVARQGQGFVRTNRRRWLALAVVLFMGIGFALGVQAMQRVVANRPQVGRPAPDFTLPQLDGPAVRLSNLRGRVVVLNFWTTWCPPCREETPALQAFYERYGDRVAYYGINVAEPVDTIRRFIDEFGVTYPILLDRTKDVARLFGVAGYPETWWIDRYGIARAHWVGPMTFEDMQRLYEETAGEPLDPEGSGPVAPGERLFDLAVDGAGRAWAATSNGLWRSEDEGSTWQPVEGFQGAKVSGVAWLPAGSGAVAGSDTGPSGAGRLFVAGSPFGVRVSDDGGHTWQDLGDGLPDEGVAGIAVSPSGRVQYVWVAGAGLYRREVGGTGGGWHLVPGELDPSLERVGLLVLDDGGRLLAAMAGGLLSSSDGGRTWREAGTDRALLDLAVVPPAAGPGTRRNGAGAGAGDSPDGGARPPVLLLGGQVGLLQATLTAGGERGGAGRITDETALAAPARAWTAVAVAPDGRFWLAGAPNGDLLRSTDGGVRWKYVRGKRGG